MTVNAMIAKFDNAFPNDFTSLEKQDWLSTCDGLCYNEVIRNYIDAPEFDGHTSASDELLVPSPYDTLYISYMAMKMYLLREEIDRYNNMAVTFEQDWQTWSNFYNRTHRVKQKAVKFF